jgi:hypothetical protein
VSIVYIGKGGCPIGAGIGDWGEFIFPRKWAKHLLLDSEAFSANLWIRLASLAVSIQHCETSSDMFSRSVGGRSKR